MVWLRQNKIYVVFIFLLCWGGIAHSEDKKTVLNLSLSQALKIAEGRGVSLLVSNERVNQAIARIGQGTSVFLPQVNGVISQKRQTSDLRSTGNIVPVGPHIGPFDSYDARVKITQTLFDAGALARLRAAHDQKELSLAEQEKTRQDLFALVTEFFVEARRAHQTVDLTQSLLTRDKKLLDIASNRMKWGTASVLELEEAKANYQKSLHLWQSAQNEAIEKKEDLLVTLGIDVNQEVSFAPEENIDLAFLAEKNIPAKNLDHPDIKVLENQLKERQRELTAEQADYLPKISAVGDYGKSGEDAGHASNTYMFGVQATVPFLEGGNRIARVNEVKSQVHEADIHLDDGKRQVEAKSIKARASLKEAEAFLNETESQFNVANQKLNLAKSRLATGIGSEAESIEAAAEQSLAQDRKNEAYATYVIAQVNLARSLGQMDDFIKHIKE